MTLLAMVQKFRLLHRLSLVLQPHRRKRTLIPILLFHFQNKVCPSIASSYTRPFQNQATSSSLTWVRTGTTSDKLLLPSCLPKHPATNVTLNRTLPSHLPLTTMLLSCVSRVRWSVTFMTSTLPCRSVQQWWMLWCSVKSGSSSEGWTR